MSAVPQRVRERVLYRSKGVCEAVVSDECRTFLARTGFAKTGHELHHRKMRSQGGPHTEANLMATCPPCHAFIHAHPEQAREAGLLVSGFGSDPVTPFGWA